MLAVGMALWARPANCWQGRDIGLMYIGRTTEHNVMPNKGMCFIKLFDKKVNVNW